MISRGSKFVAGGVGLEDDNDRAGSVLAYDATTEVSIAWSHPRWLRLQRRRRKVSSLLYGFSCATISLTQTHKLCMYTSARTEGFASLETLLQISKALVCLTWNDGRSQQIESNSHGDFRLVPNLFNFFS